MQFLIQFWATRISQINPFYTSKTKQGPEYIPENFHDLEQQEGLGMILLCYKMVSVNISDKSVLINIHAYHKDKSMLIASIREVT